MTRTAACRCGALTAACEGEPVRISVCHCLDCQRRSGSAFSAQARFPDACVRIDGAFATFVSTGDSGGKAVFRFCPACGSTIAYESASLPGLTAVPLGAFADPTFPPPTFSVWEERKHPWTVVLGEAVEHMD